MINDFLNKREQLEGEVSSMCYKVALLLSSSCIYSKYDTMINELMILNQKRLMRKLENIVKNQLYPIR